MKAQEIEIARVAQLPVAYHSGGKPRGDDHYLDDYEKALVTGPGTTTKTWAGKSVTRFPVKRQSRYSEEKWYEDTATSSELVMLWATAEELEAKRKAAEAARAAQAKAERQAAIAWADEMNALLESIPSVERRFDTTHTWGIPFYGSDRELVDKDFMEALIRAAAANQTVAEEEQS